MAETLPPLTAEDIRGPLIDLSFSVYIYVGTETDAGWENAKLVFGLLPRHRIYLATDPTLVKEWCGGGNPCGIVFGWNDKPHRHLNKKEAADFKTVMLATAAARNA